MLRAGIKEMHIVDYTPKCLSPAIRKVTKETSVVWSKTLYDVMNVIK
jgi:hypothetical protein